MATEQEIKNAERMVRVEEGVEYLKESIRDIKELLKLHIKESDEFRDDVHDLKKTQKWVRYTGRTALGALIVGAIGALMKLMTLIGGSGIDF